MIERAELSALIRSIGGIVRDACAILSSRIDVHEHLIKAIPAGPKGERGEKGESGTPGERGEKGEAGLSVKGDVGEKGDSGERGEKGEPGESIRGERGEAGGHGEKGDKGDPGAPGSQGEPGEQGLSIVGERGANGIDGKDGKDGRDGREGKDGRDGLNGKDALQIDILPAIDPEKSYPAGTYATHAGGLLRSIRTTNHRGVILDEWQIVVEGIASVSIAQGEDLRSITISYGLTGGQRATETFTLPVLIYREIYREGETYERGDVVTFGGSAWHCQEKTSAKPGDGSAAWRLMVKQGREGKAGIDGKPGADGKPGKDK